MKKILIVVNKSNDNAISACESLVIFCRNNNINYKSVGGWEIDESIGKVDKELLDCDLAVVFGGDGTMLRTAHCIGSKKIPILGINYGHLGFLTNSTDCSVNDLVLDALNCNLFAEHRSHLKVELMLTSGKNETFIAMNEACIRRDASGKIVNCSLNVNNEFVCDLRCDGVIASSATGSTAYALAAGGPLVAPGNKGIIVVSLAPHTLNSRPLITDKNDVVCLDFSHDLKPNNLSLYVDGVNKVVGSPIKQVFVATDKNETILLRYKKDNFYRRVSKVFF